MKKVIFVCLLTFSICLSKPADVKEAVGGQIDAQANASLHADQPNKTSETPAGPTVTNPATTLIPDATKNGTNANNTNASASTEQKTVPSSPAAPNTDASHKTDPTPVPNPKPENKTDKTDGKTDKTDGKTDKADGKTDKADGKSDKTDGKTDKTDNKTDKDDNKTDKNDPKSSESSKTTTTKPTAPSATPPTLQARGFDGASFVGGIILTLGLLAIGFMGFKYYKAQTERNYHTL